MIAIKTSIETLQYINPVPVRGLIIHENRFLKVNVLDSSHEKIYEDDYYISVLPYFHNATLEELDFKIKRFFSNYCLNFNQINFTKKFFNLVSSDDFLNTIQSEALFNIECIILGVLKKKSPELFLSNNFQINELYNPSLGPTGYINSKCLKIKIKPTLIETTTHLLNELHLINQNLTFRLDGNKLFELSDFISFIQMLEKNIPKTAISNIDYIEEPFKNFTDTYLFQKRSEIKIAMDESFSTLIKYNEHNFPKNIPVVVKPSLFGISTIYNWMEIHPNKRIVISSSFEHPTVKIGLDFLASKRPLEFHGLENFV